MNLSILLEVSCTKVPVTVTAADCVVLNKLSLAGIFFSHMTGRALIRAAQTQTYTVESIHLPLQMPRKRKRSCDYTTALHRGISGRGRGEIAPPCYLLCLPVSGLTIRVIGGLQSKALLMGV